VILRDIHKDEIKCGIFIEGRRSINLAFYFCVSEEAASCTQQCSDVSPEVGSKTGGSESRHSTVSSVSGSAQL
jgi:hypothetical protein